MLSLSAIRRLSRFVLADERIMTALRDLAIMHQTDLSAWTYVLTDEEIIFTHRRVGEVQAVILTLHGHAGVDKGCPGARVGVGHYLSEGATGNTALKPARRGLAALGFLLFTFGPARRYIKNEPQTHAPCGP